MPVPLSRPSGRFPKNSMASLNQLKRTGARSKKRVGRGGKRGKTSGRGGKGQTARAGNKKRPELRDIIKKLPKRRGFGKNRGRTVVGNRPAMIPVSLERLAKLFEGTSEVTTATLAKSLAIHTHRKMPGFKIVASGTPTKKFIIKGIQVSASARVAIEKAGGTIDLTLVAPAKKN